MNIGQLDRKITIQEATLTKDAAGEEVETWGTYATLYAKKARKSANEGVSSEQLIATRVETFQARYKAGVTEQMRVIESGLIYNIRGISEIGRKQGLEITAETTGQRTTPDAPADGVVDDINNTFDFSLATY
jgi:SPP1 family predicted phage head-tail adaptor